MSQLKIKKRKFKNKKQLFKQIQKQASLILNTPKECSFCQKEFIKTEKSVLEWKVKVFNEEQKIELYCPECYDNPTL